MSVATFRIWRGDSAGGRAVDDTTEISEGMVVLDAVLKIQAEQANDLAVRWNCKAGKCGSCSAEVNGMPKLMCMTRLNQLPLDRPVTSNCLQINESTRDSFRPESARLSGGPGRKTSRFIRAARR